MKVIILTGEPFPNGMAATNRIKCYARAIKEGGLDCEIVVFRRTEVYGKKTDNTIGDGTFNDVPFHFIGGTPLRGRNVLIRQIQDFLDIRHTEKYLKKHLAQGDVLFFFMGDYVKLTLRFISIAQKKGAFCVRDLCELPYGTRAETEATIHLRHITIEKQFPQMDGIISISETLLNLAKKNTLPSCKHIKVPIMVDFNSFYLNDCSADAGIPYIFHSGTLYEQKDGILGMIESFGKFIKKINYPVKFISTGNISKAPNYEREQIKRLIEHYDLADKVVFTGYVNDDTLKTLLKKASTVIINKYCTQQNLYCFSTKLGEYLAAAKPVIITDVGEATNWLTDKKDAYIVEPENTEALTNAIEYTFSHLEESKQIGKNGQETCHKCFDYHNWAQPLVEFMNQLGT